MNLQRFLDTPLPTAFYERDFYISHEQRGLPCRYLCFLDSLDYFLADEWPLQRYEVASALRLGSIDNAPTARFMKF